jgi:hypothetical protein
LATQDDKLRRAGGLAGRGMAWHTTYVAAMGHMLRAHGWPSSSSSPAAELSVAVRSCTPAAASAGGLLTEHCTDGQGRPKYIPMSPFSFPVPFAFSRQHQHQSSLPGTRVTLLTVLTRPELISDSRFAHPRSANTLSSSSYPTLVHTHSIPDNHWQCTVRTWPPSSPPNMHTSPSQPAQPHARSPSHPPPEACVTRAIPLCVREPLPVTCPLSALYYMFLAARYRHSARQVSTSQVQSCLHLRPSSLPPTFIEVWTILCAANPEPFESKQSPILPSCPSVHPHILP